MTDELNKHTKNLAEIIRKKFSVDYNLNGIKKVEKYINEHREIYENKSEKDKRFDSYRFGSYLAFCMIKNYGGVWEEHEHGKGIRINNNIVFPIQKTWKFLNKDGMLESLSSFYELSGIMDKIIDESEVDVNGFKVFKMSENVSDKKWWEFWK